MGFENNAGSRITTGLEGGIDGQLNANQYVINGSTRVFTLDDEGLTETQNEDVRREANQAMADDFGVVLNADADGFEIGNALATAIHGLAESLSSFTGDNDPASGDSATIDNTFTQGGITYTVSTTATRSAASGGGSPGSLTLGPTRVTATYDSNNESVSINDSNSAFTFTDVASLQSTSIGGEAPLEALTTVDVFNANALSNILDGGLNSTNTINISTQENAQVAISQTRNAIDMVSELRAEFGANMNRFEAVISGNQIYSENLSAARSRIQDADFAVETANLAKQQVLQQAGISALGQANASSQAILGLL